MILGLTELLIAATVVLDPGHGGHQSGAKSGEGVFEKVVTLQVAETARAALERRGIKVLMTREADEYVALRARTEFANLHKADVFVSIHCNSSPKKGRRGAETYVLSVHASDDAASDLAHSENDEGESGLELAEATGVDFIIKDLERAATHKASARLATKLQSSVTKVEALSPDRGLRQAPFLVLKGAVMPSVLVEIGYLTHPAQGEALVTPSVQKSAGEAIADGIIKFLDTRR